VACCDRCARDAALRAHPYEVALSSVRASGGTMGGIDAGECDKLFNFGVWPSDVDAFKARIDPAMRATDSGVQRCTGLAPEERAAWSTFFQAWSAFAAKETPFFGAYGEWTATCGYAKTLDGWRSKLVGECSAPLPGPNKPEGAEKSIEALSSLKWIALAVGGSVAAVALVVGVRSVIR
jgi:hypothetical protein